MPSHIDKSVLKSMSGGVQGWLKASLRAMDLIDSANAPRAMLHRLAVAEGGSRQRILRELFSATYAFLSPKVDLASTTPAQVEAAFSGVGASGDTVRKSVAFMLAFAKDAGIELSPHLLKRRVIRRPKRRAARGSDVPRVPDLSSQKGHLPEISAPSPADPARPDSLLVELLNKLPDFDTTWDDAIKARWFAAYERLLNARGL